MADLNLNELEATVYYDELYIRDASEMEPHPITLGELMAAVQKVPILLVEEPRRRSEMMPRIRNPMPRLW